MSKISILSSEIAINMKNLEEKTVNRSKSEESRPNDVDNNKKPISKSPFSTKNEKPTEAVANKAGKEDPLPLVNIMKDDSLIRSLEELTQRLGKDNKSFSTVLIPNTSEKNTKQMKAEKYGNINMKDLIFYEGYDPTYPPPPYSYHEGRMTHTQLVYMNVDNRMRGDPTFDTGFSASFDSISIRNDFVAKVYTILSFQLLITFAFVMTAVLVKPVKYFILTNFTLYIISSITLFVLMILLSCFVSLRRLFPINFFLLLLFTLCFTYTTATAACFYSEEAVLYAVGATAIITALITVLAYLNFFDITAWGFILCMAGVVMVIFGVIALIVYLVTGSETIYLVYAFLCVLLFTVYLLYDTQQILGGGRVALSPEEYILGALTLYVDIMIIFNYLLLIFGKR